MLIFNRPTRIDAQRRLLAIESSLKGSDFMHDEAWLAFSERVACEDLWHADCVPIAWPMPAAALNAVIESNAVALAAITALEERRVEGSDEDHPLMQEVLRLEAKVSALVDIVNRLVVPVSSLPARHLIRFNTIGAVIPAVLVPPATDAVLLRIRFEACLSMPLEFAGNVRSQFADGQLFLAFAPVADTQKDAVERLVFRHHRRKVAEARHLGG